MRKTQTQEFLMQMYSAGGQEAWRHIHRGIYDILKRNKKEACIFITKQKFSAIFWTKYEEIYKIKLIPLWFQHLYLQIKKFNGVWQTKVFGYNAIEMGVSLWVCEVIKLATTQIYIFLCLTPLTLIFCLHCCNVFACRYPTPIY